MHNLVYLYTLENCEACKKASMTLSKMGHKVQKISIDNPILEIGVKMLFKDGLIHAPLVVIPNEGIYMFGEDMNLLRIVSLKEDNNG